LNVDVPRGVQDGARVVLCPAGGAVHLVADDGDM
jgi:hypothetical protein